MRQRYFSILGALFFLFAQANFSEAATFGELQIQAEISHLNGDFKSPALILVDPKKSIRKRKAAVEKILSMYQDLFKRTDTQIRSGEDFTLAVESFLTATQPVFNFLERTYVDWVQRQKSPGLSYEEEDLIPILFDALSKLLLDSASNRTVALIGHTLQAFEDYSAEYPSIAQKNQVSQALKFLWKLDVPFLNAHQELFERLKSGVKVLFDRYKNYPARYSSSSKVIFESIPHFLRLRLFSETQLESFLEDLGQSSEVEVRIAALTAAQHLSEPDSEVVDIVNHALTHSVGAEFSAAKKTWEAWAKVKQSRSDFAPGLIASPAGAFKRFGRVCYWVLR